MGKAKKVQAVVEETEKPEKEGRVDRLTKEELLALLEPRSTGEEIKLNKSIGQSDCRRGRKKAWSFDALRDLLRPGVYGSGSEAELKKRKLEEEVRLRKAQADNASLAVDASRKLTLPADEVADYGRALATEIKSQLQTLGASLAVSCAGISDPREIQVLIDNRVRGMLSVLADWNWDADSFRKKNAVAEDADDLEEEEEE